MAILKSSLILSLVDHVTAPSRAIQGSIARVNDQIAANNQAIRQASGRFIGATAGLAAFGAALVGPVRAAAAFESAMADVRKVVDFETPEALAQFRKELIALTREIPMAATELTEIAAAAGQADIPVEDILKFTAAAAKIGTAFEISAGEAGQSLAEMKTALGLSVDEVILLSDAMNHLANNTATSEAKILAMVQSVASDAKAFGFSATEAAAFGAAMTSAGYGSDVAATSFLNMGRALTRGASATKRQREAMAQLGLDAQELARAMQDDAAGAVLDVLERIKQMPEEMRAALSSDLFGNEARALTALVTNTDLLRQSLNLVGDESDFAGSSFREFEVRAGTFNSQIRTFQSLLEAVGIAIGTALLPGLIDIMDHLRPVITGFSEWAAANPETIKTIIGVVGALLALRVLVTGSKFLMLIGRGGILWGVAEGLGAIAAITGAPFWLIALGVAALAGAGYLLWKNWDKNAGVIANVLAAYQAFFDLFPGWVEWVEKLINPFSRLLGVLESIKALLPSIRDLLPDLGRTDDGLEQRRQGLRDRLGAPGANLPLGGGIIQPQSFVVPRPSAPAGGARTLNLNGGVNVTVQGTNASADDIGRAIGDELRRLTNSGFSDGAFA